MDHQKIQSSIIKIELLWSTILREKSDDPRSYEYITTQAISLKYAVMALRIDIGKAIHQSKKEKLRYQKLHGSLTSIFNTLDYQPTPCKDEKYILNILDKLRKIRGEVRTLLEYQ